MNSPNAETCNGTLEHRLLDYLLDGGSVPAFAQQLGLGLDELSGRMDLQILTDRAALLGQLQQLSEQFALARRRLEAIECLGRMVTGGGARESLRRACTELLRPPRRPAANRAIRLSAARRWLEQTLASGPMPARQVAILAQQQGICSATLRRAKRQAAVVTSREGFGPGARFVWRLPTASPTGEPCAIPPLKGEHLCHR